MCERIKEATGYLPEQTQRLLSLPLGKPQAHFGQVFGGFAIGGFDDMEHAHIQTLARRAVQRKHCHFSGFWLLLCCISMPQVCRVNAVHANQLLQLFVLREQGYKRYGAAFEHMAQILQQGKGRTLHQGYRFFCAQMRLLRKTLGSLFHQTHQARSLVATHHLQSALHLVQALFGDADTRGIHRLQIRCLGRFHITNVAVQGLDSRL